MMQTQFLHSSSWQDNDNCVDLYFGEAYLQGLEDMDVHMNEWELSSSSDDTSIFCFPTMTSDEILLPLPEPFMFPLEEFPFDMDELGCDLNTQSMSDEVFGWMEGSESNPPSRQNLLEEEYEGSFSSSISLDITSPQLSLLLPREDMELDNQLSILNLLKAFGGATENKLVELAEVISKRLKEMVDPMGLTMERLAYYLVQDKQDDYLKQESMKNYEAAFRAFYQIFPYGRFAHLTANLAILEAIPEEAETIHIIDFDMGEGLQWSSLIEAIGKQRTIRLTSIKWKEDCEFVPPQWSFDDTKVRLCNHADSFGLQLEVEEMEMEKLVSEIMEWKAMSREREWLAFNCMVGLPHMGRERSRKHVNEFLQVAKEFLNNCNGNCGIVTLGDGDGVEERMRNCYGFGSFFDGCLAQFHAYFESLEWHLPSHLTDARTAMECLFLAQYMSSLSCFDKWGENAEATSLQYGLEGWGFSKQNMEQAKEIVKAGGNSYGISVEGANENVMSLDFKGTPLVRVSSWT